MDMADLSACTMGSGNDLSVDDDSAADSGSECYHNNIVVAGSAALPHLTESCHIGIISGFYRQTCKLLQFFLQLYITPVKVYGTDHGTILVDRSRNTNSHTGNGVAGDPFFLNLRIDGSSHIRKDVHAVIFRSCGDLPLIQDVTFYTEKTAFYSSSSNINTKTIFFHLYSSSGFLFLVRDACTRLYSSLAALYPIFF